MCNRYYKDDLKSKSYFIKNTENYWYSDSLFYILSQLPEGFKLSFKNTVEVFKDSVSDIIEIQEIVSLETMVRKKPQVKRELLEEKDLHLPLDA